MDRKKVIQIPSVVVLNYTPKFFNTPPFKRWKLIPLPLSVGHIWWLFYNKQNVAEMTICDPEMRSQSVAASPLLSAQWLEKDASCHVLMTLDQASGEVHPVRNWGLLPTAMWVNHCGSKSSSPSQAFIWAQPQQTLWM